MDPLRGERPWRLLLSQHFYCPLATSVTTATSTEEPPGKTQSRWQNQRRLVHCHKHNRPGKSFLHTKFQKNYVAIIWLICAFFLRPKTPTLFHNSLKSSNSFQELPTNAPPTPACPLALSQSNNNVFSNNNNTSQEQSLAKKWSSEASLRSWTPCSNQSSSSTQVMVKSCSGCGSEVKFDPWEDYSSSQSLLSENESSSSAVTDYDSDYGSFDRKWINKFANPDQANPSSTASGVGMFFTRPAGMSDHDLGDLADLTSEPLISSQQQQSTRGDDPLRESTHPTRLTAPPRPPPPRSYEPSNFLSLPRLSGKPVPNPSVSRPTGKSGSLPRSSGSSLISRSASMNQFGGEGSAAYDEAELDGMLSFPTPFDKFLAKSNNSTLNI